MSPSAVESCPRRGTFWDGGIKGGSSRLPLGEERANILLLACCYQEGSVRQQSRLPLGEERANILLLACCYQEGSNPGQVTAGPPTRVTPNPRAHSIFPSWITATLTPGTCSAAIRSASLVVAVGFPLVMTGGRIAF